MVIPSLFPLLKSPLLLQAVDGLACLDAEGGNCAVLESTPNYDASRIDTLYLGAQNPSTESFSAMLLDEIRIFNVYTEVDSESICCLVPFFS
jgi:hypothetical protein